MPAAPAVSVLMPVHNAEPFLAEAVQSIRAQSLQDFEFIIVDDGSTDDSPRRLREYAAADDRIRLISRPRTGLVAALNEMLAASRAPLIARMDADDIALPDRLDLQREYLRSNPDVVCVGGAVELIDEAGRRFTGGDARATGGRPRPVCGNADIQREALRGRTPICHPAAMFRRDAVRDLKGYRQAAYPAEDLDLWLRLGEVGELANIEQCVLRYRVHKNSISARQSRLQVERMRAVCEEAWRRRRLAGTFCGALGRSVADDEGPLVNGAGNGVRNAFARAMVLASENAGEPTGSRPMRAAAVSQ